MVDMGYALYRARQRLALALLRRNGWTVLRCASCPGATCILAIDEDGEPTGCPFETDNRVCFGEGY